MKPVEIGMAVFFILATFGPFVYLFMHKKNRVKSVLTLLQKTAAQLELNLVRSEEWDGDKAIGYDQFKRTVLFVTNMDGIVRTSFFSIAHVQFIEIEHTKHSVQIHFYSRKGNKVIEVYNDAYDEPLNVGYHVILAKKWVDFLTTQISKRPRKAA